jgi:hypothetical protein
MKLMTSVLAVAIMTAAAWAQNPDAIDNTRSIVKSVQQIKTNESNAALAASGTPAASSKPTAPAAAKPAGAKTAAVPAANAPAKTAVKQHDIFAPKKAATPPVTAAKTAPAKAGKPAGPKAKTKIAAVDKAAAADKIAASTKPEEKKAEEKKPEEKKWAMSGKRDPFFSPVVQQSSGSGCATGKKCLEIGQINVRGVVKSDNGFIAVVTNTLNKAYFLHENDPVFNGYVVRITGDSVVFQETFQDKLGKPLTREVVKKIVTPAV